MPYSSSVILYSSDFISHLSHLALQIFFFCQAYILIPNHLSVSSHNRLTLNERNCTYYEVSKLYLLLNYLCVFMHHLNCLRLIYLFLNLYFILSLSYFFVLKRKLSFFLFKIVPRTA